MTKCSYIASKVGKLQEDTVIYDVIHFFGDESVQFSWRSKKQLEKSASLAIIEQFLLYSPFETGQM